MAPTRPRWTASGFRRTNVRSRGTSRPLLRLLCGLRLDLRGLLLVAAPASLHPFRLFVEPTLEGVPPLRLLEEPFGPLEVLRPSGPPGLAAEVQQVPLALARAEEVDRAIPPDEHLPGAGLDVVPAEGAGPESRHEIITSRSASAPRARSPS